MRRGRAAVVAAVLLLTACSRDHTPSAAPASTDPTSTTVHFTGDAGSPFCALLRQLNTQDVLKGDGSTPTSAAAAFAKLRQVLSDTAAQAPPELATDISLLAVGISALDDALRSVGYSYDALASSPNALAVSAAVNDPAFATAGAQISAYKAQVCHL